MDNDEFEFRVDRVANGIGRIQGYKRLMSRDYDHPLRIEGNREASWIMRMVTQGILKWAFSKPVEVQTAFFEELWVASHIEDRGEAMGAFGVKLWAAMDAENWLHEMDCNQPSDAVWVWAITGVFYEVFQKGHDEIV